METNRTDDNGQELRNEYATCNHPDWLLERWVRLAEVGIEVGITLQVSGFLVSGTLASQRAYLAHVRAEVVDGLVQRGLPPVVARKLDQAFETDIAELDEQAKQDTTGVEIDHQFIHLKDARIVGEAGQGSRFVIPYWRGQLRRVDAFFLGTFRQAHD